MNFVYNFMGIRTNIYNVQNSNKCARRLRHGSTDLNGFEDFQNISKISKKCKNLEFLKILNYGVESLEFSLRHDATL